MIDFWSAVILGIVEGLTEFLPVSSTGHLILTGHLIGFTGDKAETFEIVIQLGAILAIVCLYYDRFLQFVGMSRRKQTQFPRKSITITHLGLAMLPALIAGFLLHGFIKSHLFTPSTVLIGLAAGGAFMIYAEKKHVLVQAKTMDDLSYKQAFQIGLAQCLSLWPGFSRSGATIAGGLLSGASLRASADFSFIVAVPMMFAASSYDLYKSWALFEAEDFIVFAVGFIVSFIVALLAVVSFLKLLEKLRLTVFAYYRFMLAGLFWLFMM